MLHTKFRGDRSTGPQEDVGRVFTIYGCGGYFGRVTQMPLTNIRSHYPWRLHTKLCYDLLSGFGEDV